MARQSLTLRDPPNLLFLSSTTKRLKKEHLNYLELIKIDFEFILNWNLSTYLNYLGDENTHNRVACGHYGRCYFKPWYKPVNLFRLNLLTE